MKISIILLLSLVHLNLYAFPKAPFNALQTNFISTISSSNYNFEGIVKLSNCSGAVIYFTGQSLNSKALVLTNGHCLGWSYLKPGEVVINKDSNRSMKIADNNKFFHTVKAQKIIYATMTLTDVAIYQLEKTYKDLKRLNIEAFKLSNTRPSIATPIEIVSGYWERGYTCAIDAFVYNLKESVWTFSDSIRYTDQGCNMIGGTSGAPIIMKGTRTVIGINNTSNESGKKCSINNPCEVSKNGSVTVIKGASYGQQTYIIYNCMNSNYEIDLSISNCKLPK